MATLGNTVVWVSLLALAACTEKPSDTTLAERRAHRLLAQRFDTPMAIQLVSPAEGGAVVCGYARPSGPQTYQPLYPFVIRDERLILPDDDLAAFEAAQRHCGPDWVGPRQQEGIP
jgi:hypothetical protein